MSQRFFKLLREKQFMVRYNGYDENWDNETLAFHIVELFCSGKELIQLPSLPNCQILCCSYNYIRNLPELPECYQLWCANNKLKELPKLPKCYLLHCGNNKIKKLPPLSFVKELVCHNNKLKELPELPKCTILNCSKNPISGLPIMMKCEKLQLNDTLLILDLYTWRKIWNLRTYLIKTYLEPNLIPKLFIKWKLLTIKHRLSVEHKERIICHPFTYHVREMYEGDI